MDITLFQFTTQIERAPFHFYCLPKFTVRMERVSLFLWCEKEIQK